MVGHWLTRTRVYPLAQDIISMLIYALGLKPSTYLQRGEIFISFQLYGCHHDLHHIETIVHSLALPPESYCFNYQFQSFLRAFHLAGPSTLRHLICRIYDDEQQLAHHVYNPSTTRLQWTHATYPLYYSWMHDDFEGCYNFRLLHER